MGAEDAVQDWQRRILYVEIPGGMKAGTEALWSYLKEHPQVVLACDERLCNGPGTTAPTDTDEQRKLHRAVLLLLVRSNLVFASRAGWIPFIHFRLWKKSSRVLSAFHSHCVLGTYCVSK